MIVRLTDLGWEIVEQPAHALLAAAIAYRWRRDARSHRWLELLAALARHDDHQPPFGARRHLTQQGAPRDFALDSAESEPSSLEQPRRALADAHRQGRYVALMVAMHARRLYHGRREESEEMAAFLDEVAADIEGLRTSLAVESATTERDYAVMLWCDRLSLILCRNEIPAAGRRLEVQRGPDGRPHLLRRRDDDALEIEPWPFEADELELTVEAKRLERLTFDDDDDLREALAAAEVVERRWCFRRGAPQGGSNPSASASPR